MEELFAPPGLWIHDLWFAREGDTYHAYYLQVPQAIGSANDWSARHDLQQIGHATSTDLIHWQDQGPVVTPMPRLWRSAIATGSVARHDGKWFMPFSATGGKDSVVGMAVSNDLNTWKVPGDGPLVTSQAYPGEWQGRKLQWKALADPYLYPEPIDGWYYMLINARVQGDPLNSAGCIGVLRSRDMQAWESAGVFSYPQWCDRMETPCVWKHGDRWYLCFGTAHDQTEFPEKWTNSVPESLKKKLRVNAIFTADQFTGPYEPLGEWWLDKMPDGRSGYIHKIIPGPDGNDVLLTSTDWKISPPYPVEYPAAGSIRLKKPQ
ncbi:glycoside hydrolase family protein [Planctomicrobium piriforme]|uniref:hypothetical protein n=1 Tax=Planctomicrobium piriforme TaxID=1576369 RepID=UPI001587CA19|nr:hypothetical protein [Planctomicrobium piriforme]